MLLSRCQAPGQAARGRVTSGGRRQQACSGQAVSERADSLDATNDASLVTKPARGSQGVVRCLGPTWSGAADRGRGGPRACASGRAAATITRLARPVASPAAGRTGTADAPRAAGPAPAGSAPAAPRLLRLQYPARSRCQEQPQGTTAAH